MSNGKLFYGSLNLSTILEEAKKAHSAFATGKNGKKYMSIKIWLNDEEDKFGNKMSVQLSAKKDAEKEKIYIGNLKESENIEPKEFSQADIDAIPEDDGLSF